MNRILRTGGLLAVAFFLSALLSSRAQARTAAISLDGQRDAAYELLAQDPAGDLAPSIAATPAAAWADLTNLYVTTDTTTLWVYVDLLNYGSGSDGQFGLAIDTDGLAASGGSSLPPSSGITYAYTSTHNNLGATPVITSSVLLPDFVVRGRLYSGVPGDRGFTELLHWNVVSNSWDGAGVNWGGITMTTSTGTHIGFSYAHGVEIAIPFADLGVPPTQTINLEFYSTGSPGIGPQYPGAWDTLPSDAQSQSSPFQATTQRRFATFDPSAPASLPSVSFSTSNYAAYDASGTAPITITIAPASTFPISTTLTAAGGTAEPADYLAVSQLLTFTPGQTSQIFPLQVLSESIAEPDETVFLSLKEPLNAQLAQPFTATLTIRDSSPGTGGPYLFLPLLHR